MRKDLIEREAALAVAEGLKAAIEWIIADVCQKRCNQPGCENPDEQCAYHLHLMRESLTALAALDEVNADE